MKKLRFFTIAIGFLCILQLPSPATANQLPLSNQQNSLAKSWLTPEFQVSPSTNPESQRYEPRAAYNWDQHEYLVVWHNLWPSWDEDIYARRVDSGGQILSWFCVATGANVDNKSRRAPDLAYNAAAKEYLVVYMFDASDDQVHWEVWGRRVAWDGSWLGPEFQIFAWADRSFEKPRVAWNSWRNEYLVVADAVDTTNGQHNDVAGRRVMADGTTPFVGHSISLQDQTLEPREADVAYNVAADEYLVVWAQDDTGGEGDIFGARVRGDNDQVINPPGQFSIDTTGVDQWTPVVATNQQDRYLVVWSMDVGGTKVDWDIYGAELNTYGTRMGSVIPIATSNDNEDLPAAAINGASNERFVIWRRSGSVKGYETWGFGWNPADTPITGMPFQIVSDAGGYQADVAAGDGFLVAYENDLSSVIHIWGKLYWRSAVFLPIVLK